MPTDPISWPDGTLITAPPAAQTYVMRGGQRHWIPDHQTLLAGGYDVDSLRAISAETMHGIPSGEPISSVLNTAAQIVVNTGNDSLGAGHFMATSAEFTFATGVIQGQTHIFTVTDLGGFHGSVTAILSDANQIGVLGGESPVYRWGVDGRWIGVSDRTEDWPTASQPFSIPVAEASSVVSLNIFHAWDPDSFQTILNKWVAVGQSIAELAQSASTVAHLFTGSGS